MKFRFIEEHIDCRPANRLRKVVGVGLRAFRSRPASHRQRSDMVTLAHIKEQSRLSYSRPRMTEELKEIGLNIGHRGVGRLMRQNGISVIRTRKRKVTTIARQAIAQQSAKRGTVITSAIWHKTCWIATSTLMAQTKIGLVTSVTFGRLRDGFIWRSTTILGPMADRVSLLDLHSRQAIR